MDSNENSSHFCEYRFWSKQTIFNFNEKLSPAPYLLLSTCSGIGVELSVQATSILQENKDYVVIRIKEYSDSKITSILPSLTCIVSILDTDGNKKFPRTFEYQCLSKIVGTTAHLKYSDLFVEERYVKRDSILENASEYLQQNALTVCYEGTLREQIPTAVPMTIFDSPEGSFFKMYQNPHSLNRSSFNIKQCEEEIEVSLPENSKCIQHLIEHSDFFREMCNLLIKQHSNKQENIDEIRLKTEELPAFLCMLLFIETQQLLLYKITISDLYKIADKYVIPTLLKECRSVIIKMLSQSTAPDILKFAHFYYDKELEKAAESYLETHACETLENDQNFEMSEGLNDIFNINPICSSVIKTETDFIKFLEYVEKEMGSFELFSKVGPDMVEIHEFDINPDNETFDFHS